MPILLIRASLKSPTLLGAILGQILRSGQILTKKKLYTEVRTNFGKSDKARRNPDKLAGPLSGRKVPFQDQGSPTIAWGPTGTWWTKMMHAKGRFREIFPWHASFSSTVIG